MNQTNKNCLPGTELFLQSTRKNTCNTVNKCTYTYSNINNVASLANTLSPSKMKKIIHMNQQNTPTETRGDRNNNPPQ